MTTLILGAKAGIPAHVGVPAGLQAGGGTEGKIFSWIFILISTCMHISAYSDSVWIASLLQ
jgi:hypothetical protein